MVSLPEKITKSELLDQLSAAKEMAADLPTEACWIAGQLLLAYIDDHEVRRAFEAVIKAAK